MALGPNAAKGYILEVDLEYPRELHDSHNAYPLAPEKKRVQREWLSPYQNYLLEKLGHKEPQTEKLLLTLHDKEKYVVHYRTLQLYLSLGLKVKQVHRVLEFEQECWMKDYILMNTEYRKKRQKRVRERVLQAHEQFGFRENKQTNEHHEDRKIKKLVASPLYARTKETADGLAAIHMYKDHLKLDKPVYTGMTVLEGSKNLIYDFYYNFMKKEYGPRCDLLYTDTDSLLFEVETEDIYTDMLKNLHLYDTSDYPEEHPAFSKKNKKVLGKMKDEMKGQPLAEVVCLRPKMHSMLRADDIVVKKAKGVKKCVVKKQIRHEHYKETLFGEK